MKGKNVPLLNIPPGVFRNSTRYATAERWFNGNQVRWENDILIPIGGWVKKLTFTGSTTPIRKMHTWRDDLQNPWIGAGSSDKLFGVSYINNTYTQYDITPASLGWNPGGLTGFGRDFFGSGEFGMDGSSAGVVLIGSWSLDNFGKLLVGVHSQDGRLVSWDPLTPSTVAAQVTNSPPDNSIVITTEEKHLMVMGGNNNPRKVKWCSREAINIWTPAENNSAGGFNLNSNGAIIAAVKVQGGILVLTDADIHIIEYIGPPDYYARRRISDEGGIVGKYAISPLQGGAVWLDHSNVWTYVGGAVTKAPCTVQAELFDNSDFSATDSVHCGINEEAQELWFFYPEKESLVPNRYAALSYSQEPYWTIGAITRTAWVNPVWQSRPLAVNNIDLYEHEVGVLADGLSRNEDIFVESGAIEFDDGDRNVWVNRIYPDFGADAPGESGDPDAIRLSFYLQQAPEAPKRLIGPLSLTNPKGYITTRFRARQMYIRIDQSKDTFWKLGKFRLRLKQGGAR